MCPRCVYLKKRVFVCVRHSHPWLACNGWGYRREKRYGTRAASGWVAWRCSVVEREGRRGHAHADARPFAWQESPARQAGRQASRVRGPAVGGGDGHALPDFVGAAVPVLGPGAGALLGGLGVEISNGGAGLAVDEAPVLVVEVAHEHGVDGDGVHAHEEAADGVRHAEDDEARPERGGHVVGGRLVGVHGHHGEDREADGGGDAGDKELPDEEEDGGHAGEGAHAEEVPGDVGEGHDR
mmetsp:Transcript_976/g.3744  ORF Transcript_976/g.3744 Transcript_976/m.3744 type:complete len:239 (+) Transcript_976:1475-2191(+)